MLLFGLGFNFNFFIQKKKKKTLIFLWPKLNVGIYIYIYTHTYIYIYTKFGYKLSCSHWLQHYLIFFYWMWIWINSLLNYIFFLILLMLAKFLENQKLMTLSSIKFLNFKFLSSKIMYKKSVYRSNSKWHLINMIFDIHIIKIKNMHSNS